MILTAGCSSDEKAQPQWVEDEVSFKADGLTIHGTYRHQPDADPGPAALLISESGPTDRNGDNKVVGPIGNMRQLAELLSDHGVASLRYDKIGTGKTDFGPYRLRTADIGQCGVHHRRQGRRTIPRRRGGHRQGPVSMYALGEGAIHAMSLASDTAPGAPKIHSLGLLQPLSGRYLDIITNRVRTDASPETLATWLAAVDEVRTKGTVPALPDGLGAILNPGNAKAIAEADKIDPVALAADDPRGHPGAVDVFGHRPPGDVRHDAAADRRARTHRADRRRTQGRQPRAARRPDRQHRQPLQAGSAFSTAGDRPRRICHEASL